MGIGFRLSKPHTGSHIGQDSGWAQQLGAAAITQGTRNSDGERGVYPDDLGVRYERERSVKDVSEGFGLRREEQSCH